MSIKKDKQKVLGEHFDDERILSFFEYQPYGDANADYHLLEKAYRGMKADNFATFVGFFVEKGHDIQAKNAQGHTFLETIRDHAQSQDYIATLQNAGA